MKRYIPLEAPKLIPDSNLLQRMYDVCFVASNGDINDFSDHSPVAVFYQGVDFALRELKYDINRQAFSVAINHLKIAGVQRGLGSQSKTTLEFRLSTPLTTPFILSANYQVSSKNGLIFTTDSLLTIQPGAITGTVTATSNGEGSKYNLAANQITNLSESRAYLAGVTNIEPSTGGTDEESLEDVLSRGFAALRSRFTLVSRDDFEQEAMRLLGSGSVAKAVGLLSADKLSYEKGAVHIFVLNADGSLPSAAQINDLQLNMSSKIPVFLQDNKTPIISTSLYISPIEVIDLSINAIVKILPGDNPIIRANEIYNQLKSYLFPGNLELGQTLILKEIENVIRQTGIEYIQSVTFQNGNDISYSDYLLPNAWSASRLGSLDVTLVDDNKQVFRYQL